MVMCVLTLSIKSVLDPISNYYQWVLNAIWVSIVCMLGFIFVDSVFDWKSYQIVRGMTLSLLKKRKI